MNESPNHNVYYYSNSPEKIAAILQNGFTNNMDEKQSGRRGVYVADSPGAPDPDYPDDQLLEITLPPEINSGQWRLDLPKPAKWNEWLIPARILNEHAKLRQLSKEEWLARWKQWAEARAEDHVKLFPKLVRLGFLEQVKDAQGRP